MKSFKRHAGVTALMLAAVGTLFLATVPIASPAGAASGSPITIAAILDLTGPTAASDAAQLQGIKLAIHQVNSSGGIHGHQINLVVADDAANPAEDITDYQRLVEQGHAVAVLGPTLTGDSQAVIQEQDRSGVYVPQISPSGDASLIYGAASKWFFAAGLNTKLFAEQEVTTLLQHSNVKHKKFGYIVSNIVSAVDTANLAKADVIKAGQKFVGAQVVGLTETDLTAAEAKLKADGVNELLQFLITSPSTILGFLNGFSQLNWKVQWEAPDISLSELYGTIPNSLINGGIIGNTCDPLGKGFQSMLQGYQDFYGQPAPQTNYDSTGIMYNGARVLFAAMDRASDPTNSASILAALNSTKNFANDCGSAPITLSPTHHWFNSSYAYSKIVNGVKNYFG